MKTDTLIAGASHLSPPTLRLLKLRVRWIRYALTKSRARAGWFRYRKRYRQEILFVAGLPKSGTSWLEQMLCSYPGYSIMALPENTTWEYHHGETHGMELDDRIFDRLKNTLSIVKLHCHGSSNNASVLARHRVPYVVLYRDLRDAAVSHVHYVRRTPWHPEYEVYKDLDVRDGLLRFAGTTLPEWSAWIDSWETHREPSASVVLRYEDLRMDPVGTMSQAAGLFGLDRESLPDIVAMHDFDRMKKRGSFFRKAVVGDWRSVFDVEVTRAFKAAIGDQLIRCGYERDGSW